MRLLAGRALVPCVLLAPPARPCSFVEPSLSGPFAPADDAADVPLNAVMHVSLAGGVVDFAAFLARDDVDDAPASLPLTRDAHVAVLDLGELAADVGYTVSFEVPPRFEGDVPAVPPAVSFRTAAAVDDARPTITTTPTADVRHFPADPGNSCGPFEATNTVAIGPLEADDDVGVAGYRLFRLDDVGGRALLRAEVASRVDSLVAVEADPGTYRYGVVAFDLAGNESEMVEVDAWVSGVGCSATRVSSTTAPASLALVAVVAATLRRRSVR